MDRPPTRLSGPVLDCSDAVELARFYANLLGWEVAEEYAGDQGSWAKIRSPGGFKIEFQGLTDYLRPVWPNTGTEQQMMSHLDIAVDNLETGVEWAIECGATAADHQPQPHVRVMLDPAGHPFCLFPGQTDLYSL